MAFTAILESWKMSFQSVHFLLFLPLAVAGYFVLPAKWRRAWLLLASYYFYFFAAPRYLPVLVCGTLFSYLAARGIAAAKGPKGKRAWLAVGVLGLVLALSFFKYNRFFAAVLSPLLARVGIAYDGGYFITAAALGISFYTFPALGYLIDLYRGDVPLEKNIITHALFLGFFPAVVSGPISRAANLMPQLNDTGRRFDAAGAGQHLRLMAWGFFKKLAVADTIALFPNAVYGDLAAHSGLTLTFAAIAFALQLYFDFSGYTDIARGAAGLLGIRLPENFNTPYFSTNFSSFWARWHMSLSAWLQDYIFTPIVWSRWTEKLPIIGKRATKPPVLSAIGAVFLVSGIWHGDTMCYVVWGALQALFRMGEELAHRGLGKPKKNPSFAVRFGKTALVLVLWVESLVFFKVGMGTGTVADAAFALGRQFVGISLPETGRVIFDAVLGGFFPKPFMAVLFLLFTGVCLFVALWADWMQCFRFAGRSPAAEMVHLKPAARWGVYFFLVLACFAAFLAQSGGFGGASFLYGGF